MLPFRFKLEGKQFFSFSFFCASTRENDVYARLEARGTKRKGNEWENREHFSFVDVSGKHKRGYFWFWIFFVLRSSLLLFDTKLSEGFTKSTITDIRLPQHLFLSSLFPSFPLGGEWIIHTCMHTYTRTYTRDIKKISLPDVDDFLICCKIITLNSIAKVLLGSHFFFIQNIINKNGEVRLG